MKISKITKFEFQNSGPSFFASVFPVYCKKKFGLDLNKTDGRDRFWSLPLWRFQQWHCCSSTTLNGIFWLNWRRGGVQRLKLGGIPNWGHSELGEQLGCNNQPACRIIVYISPRILHITSRKCWYSMQIKLWWWAVPKIRVFNFVILLKSWKLNARKILVFYSICFQCDTENVWMIIIFVNRPMLEIDYFHLVMWHCWLGGRKGMQPIKICATFCRTDEENLVCLPGKQLLKWRWWRWLVGFYCSFFFHQFVSWFHTVDEAAAHQLFSMLCTSVLHHIRVCL